MTEDWYNGMGCIETAQTITTDKRRRIVGLELAPCGKCGAEAMCLVCMFPLFDDPEAMRVILKCDECGAELSLVFAIHGLAVAN